MLTAEYNFEEALEVAREEEREEGREEGRKEGNKTIIVYMYKIEKMTAEQISDFTGINLKEVQDVLSNNNL